MSLLYFDGFDHYSDPAQMYPFWSNGDDHLPLATADCAFALGRNGTGQCAVPAAAGLMVSVFLPPGPVGALIAGLAFQLRGADTQILSVGDYGDKQIGVQITDTGALQVVRGNGDTTALATSAPAMIERDTWYYLEVKAVISATAGSFTIRLKGPGQTQPTAVLSASGVNTTGWYSSPGVFTVTIAGTGSAFDDCYLCNDAGTAANGFLGECSVLTLEPSGDGAHQDWTPDVAGPHFSRINETTPAGIANQVAAETAGAVDTYTYAQPAAAGPIAGVIVANLCRALYRVSDSLIAKSVVVSGGSVHEGPGPNELAEDWMAVQGLWERNPADASVWTPASIAAAEFGVKRTA